MDNMDRLLFGAAKEQTKALPVQPMWEALLQAELRRRCEREKRLRRLALQFAAGAAMLALGFLAGRLLPWPVQSSPAMPAATPPPMVSIPRQENNPAIIGVPKTDGPSEPGIPPISLPKTDSDLIELTLGEFSIPGLSQFDSLLEVDFTWLPAGWTIEVEEDGMDAYLLNEEGLQFLSLTLDIEPDESLAPGMGRCTISVNREGYLDIVAWKLRLKEDVCLGLNSEWMNVQETVEFLQGIVKRTGG